MQDPNQIPQSEQLPSLPQIPQAQNNPIPSIPNYTPMAPAPVTNTMAIVSLISGILSWVFLPVLAAVVGIITGNNAKKEIAASNGQQSGESLAKIGVIISWINIGVSILAVVCIIMFFLGVFAFGFSER